MVPPHSLQTALLPGEPRACTRSGIAALPLAWGAAGWGAFPDAGRLPPSDRPVPQFTQLAAAMALKASHRSQTRPTSIALTFYDPGTGIFNALKTKGRMEIHFI